MYKIAKSSGLDRKGDYYVYHNSKNSFVYEGTEKQCLCLIEMLNIYPDVPFRMMLNWLAENRDRLEVIDIDDLPMLLISKEWTNIKRRSNQDRLERYLRKLL